MKKSIEITAADLIDQDIDRIAPFYGMNSSIGVLEQLDLRPTGPLCRTLKFPPTYETLTLDEETGAMWETFDLGPNTEHWYHGQITINEDCVGEYVRGRSYKAFREEIIPDMFIQGGLYVSEKAKNIIESLAPGFCYFAHSGFVDQKTKQQREAPVYRVLIRRTLSYEGPTILPNIRPEGERFSLVMPETWTSFCHNSNIQRAASSLPIFTFNRDQKYPIFRADLLRALKNDGVSGLLETSSYGKNTLIHLERQEYYETIFPLDPDYR